MRLGVETERHNDAGRAWNPVWEDVFQRHEWAKYPPEHVIRFVARHFYAAVDRSEVRLLDLGCGPGACAWYMAREGFSVCGIDGSSTAIERARKRLVTDRLSGDLRVADFTILPWEKGYFDGVVDNVSLCTVPFACALATIMEVARVLKPGGLFLSCAFTDRTWGCGTGPLIEPGGYTYVLEGPIANKGFCRFLGRPQINDLYAGFDILSIEKTSYTLECVRRLVELWIVTCEKPQTPNPKPWMLNHGSLRTDRQTLRREPAAARRVP